MRIWNLAKVVLGGLVAVLAPLSAVHAQNTLNITYYTLSSSDPDANTLGSGYGPFYNEVQNALGPDGLPVLNTAAHGCASNCFTEGPVPSDVNKAGEIRYWDVTSPYVSQTGTAIVLLPFNVPSNFFPPNGTGTCDGSPTNNNCTPGGYQAAVLSGQLIVPSVSGGSETVSFALAADDMAFVYVDGTVVCQLGGVQPINPSATCTSSAPISTGTHTIQVFYTDIQTVQAGLVFNVTTPGVTTTAPPITYNYSGHAFTMFECTTSPNPDCASPETVNPYTTSDSVSAALSLTTPLAKNLPPTNVISLPGFVSLTMNDGQNTITVTSSSCNGDSCNGTAYVTTDANGNINAWWLDATQSVGTEDIHTLYDPSGAIGGSEACNSCYNGTDAQGTTRNAMGDDEGSFNNGKGHDGGLVYGYVLTTPGSFTPPGVGGTTVVNSTTCTPASPCQLTPIINLAVILAPGVTLPTGAVISQTQCYVPADPRGPNCGAVNGNLPKPLNYSTVCLGFGNGWLPATACGASGSGTGFWLTSARAESLDATNGLNIITTATPPPPPPGSNTPPFILGCPTAIILGGTNPNSNTEDQHPEGTAIDMTAQCDNARGVGSPGGSIVGIGFQQLQSYSVGKVQFTNQEITAALANYEYINTNIVLGFTQFPKTSTVRAQLQQCLAASQNAFNKGNYECSAQQIFQCEVILENTAAASGAGVAVFGPSTSRLLRLSDPYGNLKSRFYHHFYRSYTQIPGNSAATWLAQYPVNGPGPYSGSCPSK